VIASLCLNRDISSLRLMKEWLDRTLDLTSPEATTSKPVVEEHFERSVEEVLNRLVDEAVLLTGKPIDRLQRDDKIEIIRHLESKGAFLVRYSMDMVAELLDMSKFTIYNYLQDKQTRVHNVRPEEPAAKRKTARAKRTGASKGSRVLSKYS
jgi:predicted transcriptional regulator YheO